MRRPFSISPLYGTVKQGQHIGSNTTSLWYNDVKYELSLDNAMNMLTALEIYASACYDNTQYHISEVKKMTNVEDLKNYNYRIGYPEKLRF